MSRFPARVKLTEHLTVTRKLVKLENPQRSATRIVRISVADGDATDSSGDENDGYKTVKKHIHEIRIVQQLDFAGGDSFLSSAPEEAATVQNKGQDAPPVQRLDPPSEVEAATVLGKESYSLRSPLSALRFGRDNKTTEIRGGEGCIEWEEYWGQLGRRTEEDSSAAVDEFWWDEDFLVDLEKRGRFVKEDYWWGMMEMVDESLVDLGEEIGSCNWDVDSYFGV